MSAIINKPAIELFVGGHAGTLPGRNPGERDREDLNGKRMFTAAHPPQSARRSLADLEAMLDSGAFTDPPEKRLTPKEALDRQLVFELKASLKWGAIEQLGKPWQAQALVSYDRLIDETWTNGERHKRRWTVQVAESAMAETIEAAEYLASQRERLAPRKLVLSAQGVDTFQYVECAGEVLRVAKPGDIFGFGGWCILGRLTSLLPEFWCTLHETLPLVVKAGLSQVHIFGVLWLPALGGMVWLADQYGLEVSTDSTAPMMACTREDKKKAGARANYWRDNVEWWQKTLAELRQTEWYKEPPRFTPARQIMFDLAV